MPVLLQSLFSLPSSQRCNLVSTYNLCVESFGNYQDHQIVPHFKVKPRRIKFQKEGNEWGEEVYWSGSVITWDVAEGPHTHSILEVRPPFFHDLRQTNGKKKLKGSLASMAGRALKPATAGADTSTKVTAVEIRIVLSFPELVCNKKPGWCKPCNPCVTRITKTGGHLSFSSSATTVGQFKNLMGMWRANQPLTWMKEIIFTQVVPTH